jgi:transglutaminase-like putative cysteine protease
MIRSNGMSEFISSALMEKISDSYEKNMCLYQKKKAEVDHFIACLQDKDEIAGMMYTYAFMPVGDIVTYEVEELYPFVKGAFIARKTIPYVEQVPVELFLAYVMFYRINNENIDEHRTAFYSELLPRIQMLDMKQAALNINYWCYEKATYISTDVRTVAPLTMVKRAEGRCGEESVIAVAALRSVGIPARQCYVPRWAHCDDNHAWVELWADGIWYYIGACEPEPVLNKGWFTAAASKSMLVQAKAFSNMIQETGARQLTPLVEMVNSTKTYGECKMIEVTVTEHGIPVKNIVVHFELINFAELYPIHTTLTNEDGKVSFLTGLGDICIHIHDSKRFLIYKMDVRRENHVTLPLEQALTIDMFTKPRLEVLDMVPSMERIKLSLQHIEEAERVHKQLLLDCENIREEYKKTFLYTENAVKESKQWYLNWAMGNYNEIEQFVGLNSYSMEDKLQLLSTLREKDLADITSDILEEYLETTQSYKNRYDEYNYRNYVLAPRVANEMIRPERREIQQFCKDKRLYHPFEVWKYLKESIYIMDEYGCDTILCSAYGSLKYGICGMHSFHILYVSVCRALGMAARLNPVNHEPEYLELMSNGSYEFVPVKAEKEFKCDTTLLIQNASKRMLNYGTQITIARYKEGIYETLSYPDVVVDDSWTIQVESGSYRILTCTRQIDGAVSANTYYFNTPNTKEIVVELREDETEKKLKYVSLEDTCLISAREEQVSLKQACKKKNAIVIFAEPGKEPTEHLFMELLECKEELGNNTYSVCILLPSFEDGDNLTLRSVCKEIECVDVRTQVTFHSYIKR